MERNIQFSKRLVPFACAENAWLWCCRCRLNLTFAENRELNSIEDIPRPCQTIDIYCVIKNLRHKNELKELHINSLTKYGLQLRTPSLAYKDPINDIDYWNEAMEKLTIPLRSKGIIK